MSRAQLPGRDCIGSLQVPAEKSDLLEVVKAHRGKSEPLFLLYRVRRPVCGAVFLLPLLPSELYQPMLPALQNGILKQKIEGANTPALSQYIVQFTPVSADSDDLAVSLFCLPRQWSTLKACAPAQVLSQPADEDWWPLQENPFNKQRAARLKAMQR